jgi:hypothetical protein
MKCTLLNVIFVIALSVVASMTASPARAWNCPAGQQRVQAPPGTPTTTPYYDVVEGIAFICQPIPSSPSQGGNQSQNQQQSQTNSQQQSQNTSVNASQNTSNQNSSTSGSSSKSNSNSNSNATSTSANTNVNSLSPITKSSATGGNQSQTATASNNSSGNVSSYSESYNEVRQNPGAFAPTNLNTAPCTKGFSGGASTPAVAATLGIATTDKGCDSRQTAVIFHGIGNDYAAAKILCSTSASKRAHLTLQECLNIVAPAPIVIPAPLPTPVPTVIVVPTPTPIAAVSPPTQVAVPQDAFTTTTLNEVGECKLVNGLITNVCKRILDDAITRLNNLPNSTLRITGPIEATQAIKYLKSRVALSRVEYIFSDDQNSTIAFELWSLQ